MFNTQATQFNCSLVAACISIACVLCRSISEENTGNLFENNQQFGGIVAEKIHSLLLLYIERERKRRKESTAQTRENRSHNKPAEKWVRGAQRFSHYSSFLWITQLKEGNCTEALRVSIRQPKEPLCLDKDCVQSRSAGRTAVVTRCGTPAELGNISCKNALDMLLRWISWSHLTVNVLIKPRQLRVCVCVCGWQGSA